MLNAVTTNKDWCHRLPVNKPIKDPHGNEPCDLFTVYFWPFESLWKVMD